jgi:hypothetical protein
VGGDSPTEGEEALTAHPRCVPADATVWAAGVAVLQDAGLHEVDHRAGPVEDDDLGPVSHLVPVDEMLLADINRHVRVYGSGDDGVPLFGARTIRMHSSGQWGTKWDRARTRARLPDVRYHDLRQPRGCTPGAVAGAFVDD